MPDEDRQRQKNLALFLTLLGLAVMLFFLTIVKIAQMAH